MWNPFKRKKWSDYYINDDGMLERHTLVSDPFGVVYETVPLTASNCHLRGHDFSKWVDTSTDAAQTRTCKFCNAKEFKKLKSNCDSGDHDWGPWVGYGYSYQRRKCRTCGIETQRSVS